ncbi:putative adenylosuccinate synthetase [Rosellinia necatrix]|uniref:Adenylosuccinate synthetase n=1 Tax=Rosellinia necatrix TaxID=77044 RepID=A0A1W2TV67_ROSNE|nr:putative adenylosuccinate synthetase [Rosellinia necatrix]
MPGTLANGVSLDFHLLPSGLINPSCMSLIGSGVVFHAPTFFRELETLEAKGLSNVRERIVVSDRCQVNLDLHAAVDGLEEVELGERKIGTTGRGIGPSYSTKATRSGIRVHEIFDENSFERKLRKLAREYSKRFGDLLQYDVDDEIQRFREYRPKLAEFCVDAVHLIQNMQKHNAKILVEGANALMLDIDYGTYPYVTSSNTGLGGVFTGLAIHPKKIDQIIGVVKAYTTRVGEGIFKTEDLGEVGTKLQTIGREWGTSTGRKRRCGWIDLVVLKYSTAINHYTCFNLSKLDVLDTFPVVKLAVAYRDPDTGDILENFPADLSFLERCEVVYEEIEGWQQSTRLAATFEDLPKQAQIYIKLIEEHCGVPVAWIGVGPSREDMIARPIPTSIGS